MNKLAIATIAFATLIMSTLTASAKYGPAFDCHYADRATERAICNSVKLSRLDRKLNYWFDKAMERAGYFDQTRWLKSKQRRWLHRRNACGWNRFCIKQKYRQRIRKLRNYYKHV